MEPHGLEFSEARNRVIVSVNEAISAHNGRYETSSSLSSFVKRVFSSQPLLYVIIPSCLIVIPLCILSCALHWNSFPLSSIDSLTSFLIVIVVISLSVYLMMQRDWLEKNEVTLEITRILDIYVRNLSISQLVVGAELHNQQNNSGGIESSSHIYCNGI